MSKRRVIISGMGCITALAESADGLFEAVCAGRSGISNIESFDTREFPVRFGGEIKNFEPARYIEQRESKRMDRFTQLATAAARQAVEDSAIVAE
jgi:3-oxoacyl-[acyl-carrier-protein] synthase II